MTLSAFIFREASNWYFGQVFVGFQVIEVFHIIVVCLFVVYISGSE